MDITLKWFKERIKISVEKIIERKVEQATQELAKEEYSQPVESVAKPFKLAKLINDTLTVVLEDGNILTKNNATKQDYERVLNSKEIVEVHAAMTTKTQESVSTYDARLEEMKAIKTGLESLSSNPDFVFEDNAVYMKDVHRSLPGLLVKKFAQVLDDFGAESEEYKSLKKFWLKCCLNPNAKSAEDLYEFLTHHQFKIDRHGNFYAYRRVVSKGNANQKLVEFISNAYTKIKGVWKKKPSDYVIYKEADDGSLYFTRISDVPNPSNDGNECLGNLEKLYLELPNMQNKSYTSAHTGLEDYRIGEVISMPRQDGDDNNNISCSKGFHAASKAYDYSGFGDTPILVIINPMDVLAVPKGEWGKLRTCRWFFATTLPEEDKYILDDEDFSVSELGDIFEQKCAIDLEEHVKNSFAEEVKRHTFNLSMINSAEVKKIIKTLDEMREVISNRVKVMV